MEVGGDGVPYGLDDLPGRGKESAEDRSNYGKDGLDSFPNQRKPCGGYGPDRLNDRPGDLEKSAYDGGYNLENGFYGLPNGEEKRLYFLPNGLDKLPGGGENAANGRPNRLDAGEDVGLEERHNGGNGGNDSLPRRRKVRLYLPPYLLNNSPYFLEDLFCLFPKSGEVAFHGLNDGVNLFPEPFALVV